MRKKQQIEKMAHLMCANYDDESGFCGACGICDHDCWSYREATHLYDMGYRKASEVRAETVRKMVAQFKKPFAETDELCKDDKSEILLPASLVLKLLDKIAKDILDGEP